jgi:hypothetical protein
MSCMAREEVKAKEKGEGFTWRRLSRLAMANGGAMVPAVPAVLVAAPLFFLLSSSSGLLFFFFFGLITLLPLLSLLSFPLSSLFCFFSPLLFSRALPCIYRKNRGERGRGRPLCSHPKNAWKASGKWGWSASF